MEFTAQQLADILGGTVEGDASVRVSDYAKIEEGRPGTLSFLSNPKYEQYLYETAADIVLVNNDFKPTKPVRATLIRVPNAYLALATLLQLAEQNKPQKTGIDPTAQIAATATIGNNCYIGPFVYIGEHATIGDNTQIYSHCAINENVKIGNGTLLYNQVTIYHHCQVGNNCIIHAGSVIGADGFGFEPDAKGVNQKLPQIGNVIIEDDVEIGANTTVDRAMMGSTIIRRNAKIDNLVQVAHNVEIGESTFMCAQVGVAGSTKVGGHCILAGQVGVAGHIEIADNCVFGAQTGIAGSVRKAGMYQGSPAIDAMNWRRSSVGFKQLPDIMKRLQELEKK